MTGTVTQRPTKRRSRRHRQHGAPSNQAKPVADSTNSAAPIPWYRSAFALTLAGGVMLWLAFPPVGLWPLAWLAPVPWIWLATADKLPGRRPWLQIYLASLIHWLALLYYIRLPHVALNVGWVAMSAYLCVYLPLFIVSTRIAVRRLGVSPLMAAPLAWVGLEYIRGHLFSGFSMSLLGHTLVDQTLLIQVSDLAGGYVVSAMLMLGATAIAICWQRRSQPTAWILPCGIVGLLYAGWLGYGAWRLGQSTADDTLEPTRVLLVQGSIDTTFPDSLEESQRIRRETFFEYRDLTVAGLREHDRVDLIVWPEGKFTAAPDVIPPQPIDRMLPDDRELMREIELNQRWATLVATGRLTASDPLPAVRGKSSPAPLLVGCSTTTFDDQHSYNTAVLFDRQGRVIERYNKMHLVMFGEYIPGGQWFPAIYNATPMRRGLSPGEAPISLAAGSLQFAPSICFESTVPHLIRGQVQALTRAGSRPDVLLNLTDDGWFWGSSALDHHLACNVFRAVELRRPMLVAANTGLSAWIDGNGEVRARGPRRETTTILAEVQTDPRRSPYELIGDWPALICALSVLVALAIGIHARRGQAKPNGLSAESAASGGS